MTKSAVLSPDRTYRYTLERHWGVEPLAMFVGLNPSTADEQIDDPTIRRCIGFAKGWGMGGLLMGNLFAYRSTNPDALTVADDPVGPENDAWLTALARRAVVVVCAWGAHPSARSQSARVLLLLGPDVRCLGTSRAGYPRHPLYLKRDTPLEPYGPAAA